METAYKKKLIEARNKAGEKNSFKKPKIGSLNLVKYANPLLDWLYGIALILAILKDALDLTGVGSLPAIGTVVTFFVSFIIGMIMFLVGSSGKKKIAKAALKRFLTLLSGTFAEFILGINFLPIQTIIVIIVYYLTLKERAQTDTVERTEKASKNKIKKFQQKHA